MMKMVKLIAILATLIVTTSSSVSACTGFTASQGDTVLVGNNEDWFDPDPYIRVYPPENEKYGRIFFEFEWPPEDPAFYVPFGGINDHGLVFDIFLHPPLKPVNSWMKPRYHGDLMAHCMEVCRTVEEVLEIFDMYNLDFMEDIQYFVVDRAGSSAIIEGDEIIYKQGSYQVVTNFLQSNPEHGWYPCWRYETAVSMLEDMTELSIDYFKSICNATHQEGAYPTVYSNIYDIKNGVIYLYHYYDYENVVILNISEEFELGEHSYHLPSLFGNANQEPNKPTKPFGPLSGKARSEYTYTSSATDPERNKIYYLFDWGDGTNSEWFGPYNSGDECSVSHAWDGQGSYEIKVKAKDVYGAESEWSEPLPISMPKTYQNLLSPLLEKLNNWFIQLFGKEILPGICNL